MHPLCSMKILLMKWMLIIVFIGVSFRLIAQNDADLDRQVHIAIDELKEFVSMPSEGINLPDINQNLNWLEQKFPNRAQRGTN